MIPVEASNTNNSSSPTGNFSSGNYLSGNAKFDPCSQESVVRSGHCQILVNPILEFLPMAPHNSTSPRHKLLHICKTGNLVLLCNSHFLPIKHTCNWLQCLWNQFMLQCY